MSYNKPDTIYYKAAKKLLRSGLKILSSVRTLFIEYGASNDILGSLSWECMQWKTLTVCHWNIILANVNIPFTSIYN